MKVTYGAIVQSASGRFGGTVHSNWKGVQVVRRFTKPTNSSTAAQQDVRNAFANLTKSFLLQTSYMRSAWNSYVTGKPLINRNAWLAANVDPVRVAGDAATINPTPGDSSTLPLVSFSPAGGVGQITTTVGLPPIPSGWSIARVVAVAIPDSQDWTQSSLPVADATWAEADDATAPYTPNITGLSAGTYNVWGFIAWTAPDASTRYSFSLYGGTVVVT